MLFCSLFAIIELPEKIHSVTLNVFLNNVAGVTERYCEVEYTLGFVSVFTELPEKIPAVILNVYFKTLGGMKVLCSRIPLGSTFADRLRIPFIVLSETSGTFSYQRWFTLSTINYIINDT